MKEYIFILLILSFVTTFFGSHLPFSLSSGSLSSLASAMLCKIKARFTWPHLASDYENGAL